MAGDMARGGGGGRKVLGFRFICGRAGDSAGVLCDVSTGEQGCSCIVDGSGLIWGMCIVLMWFSDGGVSSSSGASVWVAVDCHSTFTFAWAEVLVVVGSLGTGGGIVDVWDVVCGVAGLWCEAGGCGAMWEVLGTSVVGKAISSTYSIFLLMEGACCHL